MHNAESDWHLYWSKVIPYAKNVHISTRKHVTCHIQTVTSTLTVHKKFNKLNPTEVTSDACWSSYCSTSCRFRMLVRRETLLYSWRPQRASPICAMLVCHPAHRETWHYTTTYCTAAIDMLIPNVSRTGRWIHLGCYC